MFQRLLLLPLLLYFTIITCLLSCYYSYTAATFQRMMDKIFTDVSCVYTYIDDILLFSDDEESHLNDFKRVFELLHRNNLKISISKCKFCVNSVDFLGYNVSSDGLLTPSPKLAELREIPSLTDSKSLRRFLGMIGFYRKLIPNFASVVPISLN